MTDRATQREDTRRRLLGVARQLLLERGFEHTALRDVAAAAGVALGTIFVHFTDKHDLLCAALFEDLERAMALAAAAPPAEFEPWLDGVSAAVLAAYTGQPTVARALLREALLADPPWRERFAGLIAQVSAAVQARVEAEQEAGALNPKANAGVFAGSWAAFVTFALVLWAQEAHPEPRRLVAAMVRQQLQGMLR